jgi:hypothetical protein
LLFGAPKASKGIADHNTEVASRIRDVEDEQIEGRIDI